MQFSLNAFDSSKKKELWKVVFMKAGEKRVVFESAFSKSELEQKYPDADNITEVNMGGLNGGYKN